MATSGELRAIVEALEAKVRHVRTPEGARIFKLPIGSPIGPHASSDMPAVAKKPVPPKHVILAGRGTPKDFAPFMGKRVTIGSRFGAPVTGTIVSTSPTMIGFRDDRGNPTSIFHDSINTITEANDKPAWMPPPEKFGKWKQRGFQADNYYMDHPKAPFRASVRKDDYDANKYTWSVSKFDPETNRQFGSFTPVQGSAATREDAAAAAEKALTKTGNAYVRQGGPDPDMPHRPARPFPSAIDEYPGVYGYDWAFEGDEIPDIDWEDPAARQQLAEQYFNRLGIKTSGDIHIDTLETIGGVMHYYTDEYPGFQRLMGAIGGESDGTVGSAGWFAFNRGMYGDPLRHYGYAPNASQIGRDTSYIGLNSKIFGWYSSDEYIDAANTRAAEAGWWSTRYSLIKEQHPDMEPFRIATMITFHHEVGHTLARICFGDIKPVHEGSTQEDRDYFPTYYAQEMRTILLKWKMLLDEDKFPDRISNTVAGNKNNGLSLLGISAATVTTALSKYGATNLHEMMAESWAEYMTDPQPREFALEVGALLEGMLTDFMEYDEDVQAHAGEGH